MCSPCIVQQLLYFGKAPQSKITNTLPFCNIKNTKTSLYKLSKNHWVIALLEIFGSVRRKLQSTVSLDHPVAWQKLEDRIKQLATGWNSLFTVLSQLDELVVFFLWTKH